MTTSAYRLEDTSRSIDNIIEFDRYHRTREATVCRFVPSDVAHAASVAQVARAPRARRSADGYLRRMMCENALNFSVITVVFCLTVKLILAL